MPEDKGRKIIAGMKNEEFGSEGDFFYKNKLLFERISVSIPSLYIS